MCKKRKSRIDDLLHCGVQYTFNDEKRQPKYKLEDDSNRAREREMVKITNENNN